jgi:hypothetical protein
MRRARRAAHSASMGIFKQLKDLNKAVAAAPGLIEQAQQLGANAQAMQQANAAQAGQAMAFQQQVAQPVNAELLAPIAGVDLATYAWVVKQIAPLGYDQSLLPGFAAQRGIGAQQWQQAMDGWGARINDPALAREFRRHYDAS